MNTIRNAKITTTFTRIEFWVATTIFAFLMFFFVADGLDGNSALESTPYKSRFEQADIPFYFYKNYFIPQLIRNVTLFLALLYLNFIVIPALISRKRFMLQMVLVILVFVFSAIIFGITDTYIKAYLYNLSGGKDVTDQLIFRDGFEDAFIMLAVLGIYTIIKYLSLYLIAISGTIQSKYSFIRREGTIATVIWLIVLLFLVMGEVPGLAIVGWIMAVPSAILLYLAGFYTLIPSSLNSKYPFISYALKNALILFVILIAWGFILKLVIGGDQAHLAALWIFNSVFQMCITVPVIWILYKRQMKGNEQVNVLKKELGQSNASFDFLRSQINPHFLFNALNTLYGTAIQENADRTGEGIQRLGDMMRFMLQENMQEKISLAREVDYLKNYIDLQRLRTDPNPIIQIKTELQDGENLFQIAPMLLIPFVENAFKHGISFREPSHIKVTLEVKNHTLYFDVYNSKHVKQGVDPEKDRSGVGLENVKQRLMLLYPNKHELIIRETTNEFFIHLTIQFA